MHAKTESMSRNRKKPPAESSPPADRHRQRRLAPIRGMFLDPCEVLMLRLGITNFSELVNLAVREKLERHQLWPPPPQPPSPPSS